MFLLNTLISHSKLLAQTPHPLGGAFSGEGPLSRFGLDAVDLPVTLFDRLISITIGIMTVIAGIWFIFILFSGAFGILASGGDKNKLESARSNITTGLIGLVVVIAGVFLISLVGEILGLSILTPGDFVLNVWK